MLTMTNMDSELLEFNKKSGIIAKLGLKNENKDRRNTTSPMKVYNNHDMNLNYEKENLLSARTEQTPKEEKVENLTRTPFKVISEVLEERDFNYKVDKDSNRSNLALNIELKSKETYPINLTL